MKEYSGGWLIRAAEILKNWYSKRNPFKDKNDFEVTSEMIAVAMAEAYNQGVADALKEHSSKEDE